MSQDTLKLPRLYKLTSRCHLDEGVINQIHLAVPKTDDDKQRVRYINESMRALDEGLAMVRDELAKLGGNVQGFILDGGVSPHLAETLAQMLKPLNRHLYVPAFDPARSKTIEDRTIPVITALSLVDPVATGAPPAPMPQAAPVAKPKRRRKPKSLKTVAPNTTTGTEALRPATRSEVLRLFGTFGHPAKTDRDFLATRQEKGMFDSTA